MAAPSRRATRHRRVGAILVIIGIAFVVGPTSGFVTLTSFDVPSGASSSASWGVAATASSYDWAEFHENSQLTGYAPNSTLSVGNAPTLGVKWAADLYAAALDSPVVAYDRLLATTVAYIGTESGNVLAINLANGQTLWSQWFGSPIRGTPVVNNGSIYVTTFSTPAIYKLNATTGAIGCHLVSPETIESTPIVVTPPGGVPTLYVGSDDTNTASGPMLAMNAATCALEWKFTGYNQTAGSWDGVSYGVDANGVPLVIFGTADPDSSVYALNALTGAEVWRFQAYNPGPYDVGAGAVVTPPGTNGFPGGAVYVPTKYGIMYALDLTTGAQLWSTDFNKIAGVTEGGRSTAALDGTNLVFGYNGGLFDLNALTGAVVWKDRDPTHTEVLSSPAIAGATGSEVVAAGDIGGEFDVVSLATGTQLYGYSTGGYITASPAVSNGNILIASSDQFLYDFAVGGGNDVALPSTTISSPANGASVTNPRGDLPLAGSATDPSAVASVVVAVQSGGPSGPWWDAANGAWVPGPHGNPATLGSPGAASTAWTFEVPVPSAGGVFHVVAYAVSASGQSDIKGATVGFSVLASTKGPHVKASPSFIAPGASVTITGGGFGADEPVTISLTGSVLATTTTTSTGTVHSTKVRIPTTTIFGLTALNATGLTSGKTATVAVSVTNSWEQADFGPAQTSYAPNDPVLNKHVYVGDNTWLYTAWHFDAGVPLNASPVVVDGVAYVADASGQLFALDDQNGGLLWTWTLPSGAAILGSPAVDPTKGLALVTASDGSLTAVSTASGTTSWSADPGGTPSAPIFDAGHVYVASSSGRVAQYAESSGTLQWSTMLASAVLDPPAVDATHEQLFVGAANGDEVALNTSTGAVLWSFSTGGAVTAAATVYDGAVYVGSTGGTVYELAEATGTPLWSYSVGSPITAAGALLTQGTISGKPEYAVGASNGELYVFRASTGTLNFHDTWSSAIVGIGAVNGVIVVSTAAGEVAASRGYTSLIVWNYRTSAELVTAPIVVDGTVYVAASDGNLYAFTTFGQPPD